MLDSESLHSRYVKLRAKYDKDTAELSAQIARLELTLSDKISHIESLHGKLKSWDGAEQLIDELQHKLAIAIDEREKIEQKLRAEYKVQIETEEQRMNIKMRQHKEHYETLLEHAKEMVASR